MSASIERETVVDDARPDRKRAREVKFRTRPIPIRPRVLSRASRPLARRVWTRRDGTRLARRSRARASADRRARRDSRAILVTMARDASSVEDARASFSSSRDVHRWMTTSVMTSARRVLISRASSPPMSPSASPWRTMGECRGFAGVGTRRRRADADADADVDDEKGRDTIVFARGFAAEPATTDERSESTADADRDAVKVDSPRWTTRDERLRNSTASVS